MILGLAIIVNLFSVKQLTHSGFFNSWSINKWSQIILRKIANTKCLIYSHLKTHLVK